MFLVAFRIHSSESTAGLLEQIGGFQLEYRGITEIKVRFVVEKIKFDYYLFRVEVIIKLIGCVEKMVLIKNYRILSFPIVVMGMINKNKMKEKVSMSFSIVLTKNLCD